MRLVVGYHSGWYLAWFNTTYYTNSKRDCSSHDILYIGALLDSEKKERKQGVVMKDAIILFGGTLLLVGLPLFIIGLVSPWSKKQSEKQA